MYIHKYIIIPLHYILPLPAPNIFLELEMLLPKLRLMLSEFRGRLELVGFMGDNIDGINELPELALSEKLYGTQRHRKTDSLGSH
jgi:hypothetical protein